MDFFVPMLLLHVMDFEEYSEYESEHEDYYDNNFNNFEQVVFQRNPWANAREKSCAAKTREDLATRKFDFLRSQMNMALIENTKVVIGLGCHAKSKSPFRQLSTDLVEHIWSYMGMEKPANANVAAGRSGLPIVPYEGWRQFQSRRSAKSEDETGVDLADMSLFKPGQKIIILLTEPNHHLTGPCYRDLRKHIKRYAGWDTKRITATHEEEIEYHTHRRGKVSFISAVYTIPGKPLKRKRQRRKATERKRPIKADLIPKPLSRTRRGQVRKAGATPCQLSLQEGIATSVLEDAVRSAENNGQVDPLCLQHAIEAGFSKSFVLAKAAERWDDLKDTKPPAKKTRT